MGQFSWLDCITNEQIIDNKVRDVYVLVPKEFGGGHIKESCYDGYGHFGLHDIYNLVADWNREYLSKNPNHEFGYAKKRAKFLEEYKKNYPDYNEKIDFKVSDKEWYKAYADTSLPRETVVETIRNYFKEWRTIGIDIACYDEDNAVLKYPIKITHDENAVYEDCKPSLGDPNQGWESHDDDDDDWY